MMAGSRSVIFFKCMKLTLAHVIRDGVHFPVEHFPVEGFDVERFHGKGEISCQHSVHIHSAEKKTIIM